MSAVKTAAEVFTKTAGGEAAWLPWCRRGRPGGGAPCAHGGAARVSAAPGGGGSRCRRDAEVAATRGPRGNDAGEAPRGGGGGFRGPLPSRPRRRRPAQRHSRPGGAGAPRPPAAAQGGGGGGAGCPG